jgi:hypothetical protein
MNAVPTRQTLAARFASGYARATRHTRKIEVGHDSVARTGFVHALASGHDLTHDLVAWGEGKEAGGIIEIAVHAIDDGEADTTGLDLDEHLPGAGVRNLEALPARVAPPFMKSPPVDPGHPVPLRSSPGTSGNALDNSRGRTRVAVL